MTGVRRSQDADGKWTVADVPLLDEAAELLGADDSADKAMRRAAERQRREEEEYAQGVLELTGLSEDGMLDAATVAARNRDEGPDLTTAERAAMDRSGPTGTSSWMRPRSCLRWRGGWSCAGFPPAR